MFFNEKYTRQIPYDITKILKDESLSSSSKAGLCFDIFCWGGEHYLVKEFEVSEQQLTIFSNTSSYLEGTILDIIRVKENEQTYTIIALANGELLINKGSKVQLRKSGNIKIRDQLMSYDQCFCRVAYFSYVDSESSSNNQYFIVGIKYSGMTSIYSIKDINNITTNEKIPKDESVNYIFTQYDELNQILICVNNRLNIYCYKMNESTRMLDTILLCVDKEHFKAIGINDQTDLKGIDFQYNNGQYNLFVLGQDIGIFTSEANNMDEGLKVSLTLQFIYNPYELAIAQSCKKGLIKIFADKRRSKFESKELTVIYDKIILKIMCETDEIKVITDLKQIKDVSWDNLKDDKAHFQKYYCLYGGEGVSYHVLTYSDALSINQEVEQQKSRIFVSKEEIQLQ